MYSLKCVDHLAAEEVLTILESHGYKAHIDGKDVKTSECITDADVVAEIFPFKAYNTVDMDGTYYD